MNLIKLHEFVSKTRPDVLTLWLEDGVVMFDSSLPNQSQIQALIDSYVEVPEVPRISVTNQQLRQALILKAFNDNKPQLHPEAIRDFISTLPEPTKSIAFNYWEYSNEMFRQNPILAQLAPMLGLTETDLDNLWAYAKTLS